MVQIKRKGKYPDVEGTMDEFLDKLEMGGIKAPQTQALGINTVSLGGISEAIVDLRMIFQVALLANASSLVCVHNHPSGNVQPSIEDDLMTFKILAASKVMNIELVDHLIISDYRYYSYADCGRFN